MKIISKSYLANKNIRKYFIAFSLILIVLMFLLSLKDSINTYRKTATTERDRTILIKIKNNITKEELETIPYIFKITTEEEYLKIIFNDTNDINKFKKDYKEYYTNIITYTTDNTDLTNIIDMLTIIINILIIIFTIILIIIITINYIEILIELKEEISLYKILGFKNKTIFKYLFTVTTLNYIFIYLISLIEILIIIYIFNLIINMTTYTFNLILFKNYISLFIIIFLIILIMNIIDFLKIKKISPISLKKQIK